MSRENDVLEKAADLIDKYGWVQGKPGSRLTGFCAIGAILHADPVLRRQG